MDDEEQCPVCGREMVLWGITHAVQIRMVMRCETCWPFHPWVIPQMEHVRPATQQDRGNAAGDSPGWDNVVRAIEDYQGE